MTIHPIVILDLSSLYGSKSKITNVWVVLLVEGIALSADNEERHNRGMARALLVVDVQNDFCEGGSLAVAGGTAVARTISDRLDLGDYDHAIATRDHHVDPGSHFSPTPDYVDSWPAHCVAGSAGAELHPDLDRTNLERVFDKGEYEAAYSGFEGIADADGRPLLDWLRAHHIDVVEIVGIATDHCVRATALDARSHGFITHVRLDLTAGVARATVDRALEQMRTAGVELVGQPVVGTLA